MGMEILTPVKTIRAVCLECSGGQAKEVRECPFTDCPLWHFRMGKKPLEDVFVDEYK